MSLKFCTVSNHLSQLTVTGPGLVTMRKENAYTAGDILCVMVNISS